MIHADAGDRPLCNARGFVTLTIYSSKITCGNCKKALGKK